MGNRKRKVLLLSDVRRLLESRGWILQDSCEDREVYRDGEGNLLPIQRHTTDPRLAYLDTALTFVRNLRAELVALAHDEEDVRADEGSPTDLGFDVFIDPGESDVEDIQALFAALSVLDRAAGGFGLTFRQVKEVSV